MNRMNWVVVMLVVALVFSVGAYVMAADAAKTVSGKSCCGGCTGAVEGCCLMLTDKDGGRWVLKGECDSLTAAFQQRSGGKTMTATLSGDPVTKKGKDGKDYKEVKVSAVKVEP